MFKEILKTIPDIQIFPIIATIVFFLAFVGIIIWTLRAKKSYLKRMSELPLDSSINHGEKQ